MKKSIVFLLLISLACSSVKIKGVSSEEGFAISKYKTFSFYEVNTGGDAIGPNSQENLKLIKEAIANEMSLKGLTMSGDKPDLLVNIGIVVIQDVQTRETNFRDAGDRATTTTYVGQRTYSFQSGEVAVGTYRQGTVIVHLVDQAANKLAWQGMAESVLPEKQKNIPALIKEAMTKLFKEVK